MNLGAIVGLFADVHGEHRTLSQALDQCRAEGVTSIALLGDLVDRTEQADACAAILADWHVVGVYGNHEREIALAAAEGEIGLRDETVRLFTALQERIVIEDICFTHEQEQWGHRDHLAGVLQRGERNGHRADARITFSGHTHFRLARDERGPIDIARGRLTLDPRRRYLINPGALAVGQFAIWDRTTQVIEFRQV